MQAMAGYEAGRPVSGPSGANPSGPPAMAMTYLDAPAFEGDTPAMVDEKRKRAALLFKELNGEPVGHPMGALFKALAGFAEALIAPT